MDLERTIENINWILSDLQTLAEDLVDGADFDGEAMVYNCYSELQDLRIRLEAML